MTDTQTLIGGAPTKSEILVNVDNLTIVGNGAIDNPLRAVGGGNSVEHLAVGVGGGAIGLDTGITFVSWNTVAPEAAIPVLTLADGLVDGQVKIVYFNAFTHVQWKLTPASFRDGVDVLFVNNAAGAATLAWDADEEGWSLISTHGGTVQ